MNRRHALSFALAGVLVLGLAACGDDSSKASDNPNPGGLAAGQAPADPNCPPPDIATIDPNVLAVTAEPVGPLVSGKPAEFKVTVTNTTDAPVPLVFASSQQVDVLLSQGGTQKYDWAADRSFAQEIRCQTLDGGGSFSVQVSETNPLDVPPGDYTLTARSITAPYPPDFTAQVTVG
ncbi:MAG TPA: BsuPI-related putative proteinase inhibitor [Acidimicrobiales bacterium]|nr:BsuPI-related putative proteinase inhibitor [Acidimicrobiales bacterium]